MKSVCIKTNKESEIDYLLNAINEIKLDKIYYSKLKFKTYYNIIIHYKGRDYDKFFSEISRILSNLIIEVCEENIIKKIISYEYFYFNYVEREKVLDFIYDLQNTDDYNKKYTFLYDIFYSYIINNKRVFLEGFIHFRIKEYIKLLTEKVDTAVNSFLIDREYSEFISILKLYIKSQKSHSNYVYLLYSKCKAVLLDENKNVIEDKSLALNAKYLSDISFSKNDYAFNTLLSLVPKKIYIHLIDGKSDEFIDTLKLIFEDRVVFRWFFWEYPFVPKRTRTKRTLNILRLTLIQFYKVIIWNDLKFSCLIHY